MPKLGESREETAARENQVMEWALGSGASRDIVQAYRRGVFAGDGHISAICAAYKAAGELGCQRDGLNDAVEFIIEWAKANHAEWFYRCVQPEEKTPAKTTAAVKAGTTPTPGESGA
jgi:hypothetical protein